MALLPIHQFFSRNAKLTPCSEFIESENEGGIYEVLRVVDGIPLFLEDHLERFYCSAKLAQKSIRYNTGQILEILNELISENQVSDGNILISCKENLKAFFIAHSYPSVEEYKKGVKCGLLNAERNNPNAKVFQTQVRTEANRQIALHGFYEMLLVDHNQNITEGSRSNVFVVSNNKIITPPSGKVLMGITRQKTIICAQNLNIEVEEQELPVETLSEEQAVFLTGTSPKILPVKNIGSMNFDVNSEILRQLMYEYNQMINSYIAGKKNSPIS